MNVALVTHCVELLTGGIAPEGFGSRLGHNGRALECPVRAAIHSRRVRIYCCVCLVRDCGVASGVFAAGRANRLAKRTFLTGNLGPQIIDLGGVIVRRNERRALEEPSGLVEVA